MILSIIRMSSYERIYIKATIGQFIGNLEMLNFQFDPVWNQFQTSLRLVQEQF